MSSIEEPTAKELFELEFAQKLELHASSVGRYASIYEEAFPPGIHNRPLGQDDQRKYAAKVRPLVNELETLLQEIVRWAAATGIPDLTTEEINDTI